MRPLTGTTFPERSRRAPHLEAKIPSPLERSRRVEHLEPKKNPSPPGGEGQGKEYPPPERAQRQAIIATGGNSTGLHTVKINDQGA